VNWVFGAWKCSISQSRINRFSAEISVEQATVPPVDFWDNSMGTILQITSPGPLLGIPAPPPEVDEELAGLMAKGPNEPRSMESALRLNPKGHRAHGNRPKPF
jgi:hypothetical protein